MIIEDYRRIFDFFFSGVEIPEKLRQQFFGWLEIQGNEPETKALLEEYWNEVSSAAPEFNLTEGLEKLMARLGAENSIDKDANGSIAEAKVNARVEDAQTDTEKENHQVNAFSGIRHEEAEAPRQERRKLFRSKTLKYCIAAAAAAALFLTGAATSELVTGKRQETVLMASSENISSYTLPDGSKVWLNKNSWLAYNQKFGKRTRQVALKGEGYFEVNRDERRPFIVKMQNDLDIKVLGTTFNACNYPSLNKAEVILRSGSVQVSDNGRNEYVILKPNQKFTWNEGSAEISSVNAMNCCRWFEHRLVFDNVKLKDILENLSHKYQTEISLNVGNLADKHMSMTIRDESVEDILDILTTLLPIRWRYQGAEIIIENKTKKH
uniref:FecR family protein n=1 Tax=Candidatus Cryptobacteroides bacterium TaxID=3085639 RepID=UPI00402629FA